MFFSIRRELLSYTSDESVLNGGGVQAGTCSYMVGQGSVHPIFLPKDPLDGLYSLEHSFVRPNRSL